jgi:proton-dependent oligopeptide transporter, POT family
LLLPAISLLISYIRPLAGFYAAINLGSLGAISASFLARDHGYWVAYMVPTTLFVLVPIIMVLGKKNYHLTPPRGSVLLDTMRVIRLATKGKLSLNPVATYRRIKAPDFWNNAMPSHYTEENRPKAMLWDDEFVREVSRTCKACLVFLYFPIFWLSYSQIDGNLTTVAAGMTLNGTPNDLLQNLNPSDSFLSSEHSTIFPYFLGLTLPPNLRASSPCRY